MAFSFQNSFGGKQANSMKTATTVQGERKGEQMGDLESFREMKRPQELLFSLIRWNNSVSMIEAQSGEFLK